MQKRILDNKKKLYALLVISCGILVLCALSLPRVNDRIANVFFGGRPALYNVAFAQFFFSRSALPMIGKPYPYANHQLSRTYFIQGDNDRALYFAQRELELYPEHKKTYYILGLTLGYMGREKEAISAFGEYIQYYPKAWAPRNDKAWLLFRIGEIDEAMRTIEPVAHMTSNPWVQNTYGTLLMNKGRYAEAEVAFMNAKEAVGNMNERSWGVAYPGNDPRIYGAGLRAMSTSIEKNIALNKSKRDGIIAPSNSLDQDR